MKAPFSTITHGAALVLGVLLSAVFALSVPGKNADKPARSDPKSEAGIDPKLPPEARAMIKEARNRATLLSKLSARDFRKAWDAIADQSLGTAERHQLQMMLLRQWAEVDLEGALEAAFDTSWDSEGGMGGIRQLLGVFSEQFAKRPTDSWDLITSGKFGLGAAIAKGIWAEAVVKENPLLVVNSFSQIPYHTRTGIFAKILESIKQDPSKIGQFYDKLAELPQNEQYLNFIRDAVTQLGARGTTEELRSKFLGATSEAQRTILIHEYGKALGTSDLATIQAELSQLPEADRGRMLRSINIHSPVGENTPKIVEMILEAGEYAKSYQAITSKLREYAKEPEKQVALANWAMNLPQSEDAAKVVHRAVEPYLMADPKAARGWLESLPSSWAKDRALAEYSQHSVWRRNDSETSWWAINQISNPQVKATATQWRSSWKEPVK
ncbi:MAG TPA: hypothetical protein VM511_10010 [Luteolibacter sp.]|nr:hypothetical protein [Luteolibacter sp.]